MVLYFARSMVGNLPHNPVGIVILSIKKQTLKRAIYRADLRTNSKTKYENVSSQWLTIFYF